jgi:hypothetical protein
MRSVKDYRNKLIIVWHEVRRKLYMGRVFIVRTFDFGQIHFKEELGFISTLVCLGFRCQIILIGNMFSHSESLSDTMFPFQTLQS